MKKKIILYGGIAVVILLIVFIAMYIFFPYKIYLNGQKEITINYGEKYIEEGAKLKKGIIPINKKIQIESNIDTNKLGDYTVTYTFSNLKVTRIIHIVDKEAPEIIIDGKDEITLCVNVDKYVEPKIEVKDNYDKTIENIKKENNIKLNEIGEYEAKYTACDSSNNCSEKKIKVIVKDTQAPKITINKGNLDLILGEEFYTEYGISATDNYDKTLTQPKIESNVDSNKAGNYIVKYTVCDSSNNCSTKERKVKITKIDIIHGEFISQPKETGTVPSKLILDGRTKKATLHLNACFGILFVDGTYSVKKNEYTTILTFKNKDKHYDNRFDKIDFFILNNDALKVVSYGQDDYEYGCSPQPEELYVRTK